MLLIKKNWSRTLLIECRFYNATSARVQISSCTGTCTVYSALKCWPVWFVWSLQCFVESKSKTTTNKKISRLKNKKFRSVSTQLRDGSTEPDKDGTNILQKYLFYTNKDPKNYPFINIGISIPNVTWKLTKNYSHIIRDGLISGYSSYFGNNQISKHDIESSSIPANHTELFYHLNGRLLLTRKLPDWTY